MAADLRDIEWWIEQGKTKGATHTIIVCDTFDYTDYPVHVMPNEDINEVKQKYDGRNMQRVMEVYKHSISHEEQLNTYRAYNL
jgi:hypothetical protein